MGTLYSPVDFKNALFLAEEKSLARFGGRGVHSSTFFQTFFSDFFFQTFFQTLFQTFFSDFFFRLCPGSRFSSCFFQRLSYFRTISFMVLSRMSLDSDPGQYKIRFFFFFYCSVLFGAPKQG